MRTVHKILLVCAVVAGSGCVTSPQEAESPGKVAVAPSATAPKPAPAPTSTSTSASTSASADWDTFGGNNARTNANMAPTRITAANVGSMVRTQVQVSAPIDAGLIYLKGVQVNGASRDVYFGTTNVGRTVAIDANEGKVLWEYATPGFDEVAAASGKTPPNGRFSVKQITNSTPVADANRQFIYAAGADGKVTKIAIADGKAVWSTAITKMPEMEKMDSPLSFANGKVLVPTAGYVGDAPPYQGHIAVLNAQTGALEQVWNSLCSDRPGLLDPKACPQTQSAIWGRAGIVIEPATGNLLFATGNAPWDGKTAWGDALIVLDPNATKMVGNWTTTNNAELNQKDLDMGSTTPALLGGGYYAQGGKDGTIRLVQFDAIKGTEPHQGNEVQIVELPGKSQMLTAPAVATVDGKTWLFVSLGRGGTVAWTFGADHKLKEEWKSTTGGTTPFYAGGLLYIYEAVGTSKLHVLDAATGKLVADLPAGAGHWNSAIVADNRIALPEGAISGFSFGAGGGRPGAPGAAPGAAPAAQPAVIPAGIVNIYRLP